MRIKVRGGVMSDVENLECFVLEQKGPNYYGAVEFRYRSLVNGSVGPWTFSREKAEKHGKDHARIVINELQRKHIDEICKIVARYCIDPDRPNWAPEQVLLGNYIIKAIKAYFEQNKTGEKP